MAISDITLSSFNDGYTINKQRGTDIETGMGS